jgi:hypothetical protein
MIEVWQLTREFTIQPHHLYENFYKFVQIDMELFNFINLSFKFSLN